MLIGTSSKPWTADEKALKSTFDKFLYLPWPKYASLVDLWKTELTNRIRTVGASLPDSLDISSLAHICIGYSAGSICKAIRATLTDRRLDQVSLVSRVMPC